jgi:hypothetical protein
MRAQHHTLAQLREVFRFHDVGINYARAGVGEAILYCGEMEDPRDIPVVRGRDFGALTPIGHSAWLRHDWRERVPAGARVSVREPVYRTTPKLLLRQTGDRPVVTLDREGVYFGRSVIAITASSQRELLCLAAVLNSDVFAALYRALVPEAGRRFAQVKVNKLKAVSVPEVGAEGLAELAAALLAEEEEARRRRLREEIETRVACAYGLTQKERDLIASEISADGGRGRRVRRGATS